MGSVEKFTDIIAWQKAHQLVLMVYKTTESYPATEKFGLVCQMRRAAVSIASNIVEGFVRKKIGESLHFYNIANASLEELKYQLLISYDSNIILNAAYSSLIKQSEEVGRTLFGWVQSQKDNTCPAKAYLA